MRKMLVILTSTVITVLNINSFGELDTSVIESSKSVRLGQENDRFFIDSIDWDLGSTIFKLFYFAELMFVSEISRKK